MDPVVSVEGLRKAYGPVIAADDVTFAVAPGEVFGMVGPNGAGKTTILECVTGLRRVGLDDRPHARVFALSGGQRQRLFIALALVHEPEVVLLDELTTGLDPQARRDAWSLVREIRERGATVILTTHYMEQAERLCERVAIVDRGRIVARLERLGDRVIVSVRGVGTVGRVTTALEEAGVAFDELRVERPTLEDVFLARTGGAYAGAHPRDGGAVPGGGDPRDAGRGAAAAEREP
ncbi:MAG: ABC transporter ATP-binding protein [Trueperaceae bacterium]|nr:ABC transporter ATP-binding protein [Trueperaceae bacterium]